MKKIITSLYLNILLILGLSFSINGQTATPITVSFPQTFSGTDYLKYSTYYPQSLVQYRVYSESIDHLIDSSFASTISLFEQIFSTPGTNLKPGINSLSITGTYVNKASKISTSSVTIDGILNENYTLKNIVGTSSSSTVSNSVMFGLLWDDLYLYVGVQVIDSTPNSTSTGPLINDYNFDSIELFIDPMNLRSSYTNNCPACNLVRQFRVGATAPKNSFNTWPSGRDTTGIRSATTTFSGGFGYRQTNSGMVPMNGPGYIVEFAIPWYTFFGIATVPGIGLDFGFTVACNDNQTTVPGRSAQMIWPLYDPYNWMESVDFGHIQLDDILTTTSANLVSGAEVLVATFTTLGIYPPVIPNPAFQIIGTLSQYVSNPGLPSDSQILTLSGINLTANVNLSASDYFEISTTSGTGFGSGLSVIPTTGSILGIPIYVRYNSTLSGVNNGSIIISTCGTLNQIISLSGLNTLSGIITEPNTIGGTNTISGTNTLTGSNTVPGVDITTGTNIPSIVPVIKTQNGYVFTTTSIYLAWSPVSSAVGYCIEISDKSDFSTVLYSVCGISDTFLLISTSQLSASSGRIEAINYSWRVSATFAQGQGNWSNSKDFVSSTGNVLTINNDEYLKQVKVYPNPNVGNFMIEVPDPSAVEIINSTGIKEQELLVDRSKEITIGTKGFYLLKINSTYGVSYKKIMIE